MLLILFQKHPQLLAQRVGKIVRKPVQPFSLPLLSHNLIRRKCLTFRRSRPPAAAAELKALVRMQELPVSIEPEGEEFSTLCSCCSRPIYWGHGWLMSEGQSLAAFWYQWSEGHQGRFNLAVARFDDEDCLVPGVVCVSARIEAQALIYAVLEPEAAPWSNFGAFGAVADRESALEDGKRVFALVDAISANDRRLSARILTAGLQG